VVLKNLRHLILLIDFTGHPPLGDEHTNNLRYSALNTLAFGLPEDLTEDYVIISDHFDHRASHEKISEVKKMVTIEKRHTWININPDEPITPPEIVDMLKEKSIYINNVIIGGTNTAGCVLRSRPYSAIHWAKCGYDVKIFLQMCAEYQMPGHNQAERNMYAFTEMWNEIKTQGLTHKIDPVTNIKELFKEK
tara:strand:+ start:14642 stop:15217 length:576 start_codon:yes stop_codon:yes gene_type:complete